MFVTCACVKKTTRNLPKTLAACNGIGIVRVLALPKMKRLFGGEIVKHLLGGVSAVALLFACTTSTVFAQAIDNLDMVA